MSTFVMRPDRTETIEQTVIKRLLDDGWEEARYRDAAGKQITITRADFDLILEAKPGPGFLARVKASWPDRATKQWVGLPHPMDIPREILVTLASRLANETNDTVYVVLGAYGFPVEPGAPLVNTIQSHWHAAYDVGHG